MAEDGAGRAGGPINILPAKMAVALGGEKPTVVLARVPKLVVKLTADGIVLVSISCVKGEHVETGIALKLMVAGTLTVPG